jgi:hypothetical protein
MLRLPREGRLVDKRSRWDGGIEVVCASEVILVRPRNVANYRHDLFHGRKVQQEHQTLHLVLSTIHFDVVAAVERKQLAERPG